MKSKITVILTALFFAVFSLNAQPTIDVVGTGAQYNVTTDLNFSDVGSIDYIVVEAVYKSVDPVDGPVEFVSSSESFSVDATPVEYVYTEDGTTYGTHPSYFRATMAPASTITLYSMNNSAGIHSFVAYVFRSNGSDHYSLINDDHIFFYHNGESNPGSYDFPIATATAPRDITVNVVISEMAYDSRQCVITVIAGAQLETHIITQPNLGDNLNIEPFTLTDVPGDVTDVTVSIYSPRIPYNSGDSFITGNVVLDIENDVPPEEYCTLTQGFYGNYGGQFNGQSTYDLLYDLLATDLVLGGSGNTLTLTQADVDCLIGRLPGGGPSASLDGMATCDNPVGIQIHNKNGRFKNALLAQTITLGLNLRLDGYLGGILLSDLPFSISTYITDYLGSGADISDLYNLANDGLAGDDINNISLSSITDAIGSINDHFDECNTLEGDNTVYNKKPGKKDIEAGDNITQALSVFPNPVSSTAAIEFNAASSAYTTLELYDLQGRKIDVVYEGNVLSGETYNVTLNVSNINKGLYLLILRNGDQMYRQKLNVN